MNKEKFQKKCQELIEYENGILQQVEQSMEYGEKKKVLKEMRLKFCAFLTWNYYGEETIFLERPKMLEHYKSDIVVKICRQEDNIADLDLHSINIIFPLSVISKGIIFRLFKFNKLPIEGLFERIQESYQSVINNGYEKTLSNI